MSCDKLLIHYENMIIGFVFQKSLWDAPQEMRFSLPYVNDNDTFTLKWANNANLSL